MANMTLLEDVEEMRRAASGVSKLAEDFDGLRMELKASIENELNTTCSGDVANEFTNMYNEKIDPNLQTEKARLDIVAATLNGSAEVMENAENVVKSAF